MFLTAHIMPYMSLVVYELPQETIKKTFILQQFIYWTLIHNVFITFLISLKNKKLYFIADFFQYSSYKIKNKLKENVWEKK